LKKDFEEQGKAFEIGAGVGLQVGQGGDMTQAGGIGEYGGGMDGDFGYGQMSMGATQGASAEDPYQY
jgi:hypothetical protein